MLYRLLRSIRLAPEPVVRFSVMTAHLLVGVVLMVSAAQAAVPAEQPRVALVIGNDAYDESVGQLYKAVNDARTVAQALEAAGFDVLLRENLDRRGMNRALSELAARVEPGGVAALFYAGHGVEVRGENLLLPVDVPPVAPGQEEYLKGESIRFQEVLDRFAEFPSRINLIILDACRNNPFERSGGRGVGGTRGLAPAYPPEGTFIIYSAGARQTALDRLDAEDPDPNSVFSRVFVPLMQQPGKSIREAIIEARSEVRALARRSGNHEQFPAYYDGMSGEFYLRPADQSVAPPSSATADPADREAVFWQSILDSADPADFRAYLDRYPDGIFAGLAANRLRQLAAPAETGPDQPAARPPDTNIAMRIPDSPDTASLGAAVVPPGDRQRRMEEERHDPGGAPGITLAALRAGIGTELAVDDDVLRTFLDHPSFRGAPVVKATVGHVETVGDDHDETAGDDTTITRTDLQYRHLGEGWIDTNTNGRLFGEYWSHYEFNSRHITFYGNLINVATGTVATIQGKDGPRQTEYMGHRVVAVESISGRLFPIAVGNTISFRIIKRIRWPSGGIEIRTEDHELQVIRTLRGGTVGLPTDEQVFEVDKRVRLHDTSGYLGATTRRVAYFIPSLGLAVESGEIPSGHSHWTRLQ